MCVFVPQRSGQVSQSVSIYSKEKKRGKGKGKADQNERKNKERKKERKKGICFFGPRVEDADANVYLIRSFVCLCKISIPSIFAHSMMHGITYPKKKKGPLSPNIRT